jgi:ferredoxin-NADP reductase
VSVSGIMRTPPPTDTRRYAHWGHYAVYYAGLAGVLLGVPSFLWAASDDPAANQYATFWSSAVALVAGLAAPVAEFYTWQWVPLLQGKDGWRTLRGFPWRGAALLLVSAPMLATPATLMAGFTFALAGALYVAAVVRGERCEGKADSFKKPKSETKAANEDLTVADYAWRWVQQQFEAGEVSKWVVLLLYVTLNLALGIYALVFWSAVVDAQKRQYDACINFYTESFLPTVPTREKAAQLAAERCGAKPLSGYAPFAKVFGTLLNLNSALLVLPVARTLVRAVNNITCGPTWSLAHVLPLRKNITFHKMLGRVVGVFSVLHIFFHWLNFGISPSTTLATFPMSGDKAPWYGSLRYAPWYTGALITLAMLLMYPASAQAVKSRLWEGFWFAHHFYVLYYVALLFHGPVFWQWALVPLTVFVVERIYRNRQASTPFYLHTVRWVDPVLELQFVPRDRAAFQFVEGQYLWLNVPAIAASEWHPFTISSAVGDLDRRGFMSLHIRVHRGGWTERLKDYLEVMNPKQEYPFYLTHRDTSGEVRPGKILGPEGLPLLRIDGPHAAPAQHYAAYESAVIVGAGIGLTPSASIIRSVLLYKWRHGFNPTQLTFVWIVRQNEIDAFQWFLAALTELEAERARDVFGGNINPKNFLEMHVFVTQVKADAKLPDLLESAVIPPALEDFANFTVDDLLRQMHKPQAKVDQFLSIMSEADRALGDMNEMTADAGGGAGGGAAAGAAPTSTGTSSSDSSSARAGPVQGEVVVPSPLRMISLSDGPSDGPAEAPDATQGSSVALPGGPASVSSPLLPHTASTPSVFGVGDAAGGSPPLAGAPARGARFVIPRARAGATAVPQRPPAPNRLQDLYIWDGRPDWDPLLSRIRQRSVGAGFPSIAVTFCGAEAIAQDLKKSCTKNSSLRDGVTLTLYKETF